jgi:hypothetical protein
MKYTYFCEGLREKDEVTVGNELPNGIGVAIRIAASKALRIKE